MATTLKVRVFLSKVGETICVSYRSPYTEVKNWYQMQLQDLTKMLAIVIENIVFSREEDCLLITYTRKDECDEMQEVIADMIADPDDDGNYPIKFGEDEYFVSGELII